MSQILDRQTLITEFEAYIKRSFNIDRQDTFIQLSHDRIFRDLRVQENMLNVTLTAALLMPLPADFVDVRELSYMNGSRRVVLSSVGRHRFALSISITGNPIVYSIMGNEVEVAPKTLPADFSLWYWQKLPQMVNPTDTNVILTTYPYIYLYAMLVEGSVYIQDDTMRAIAVQTYEAEVQRVNKRADESRHGEAPVIGVG